MVGLVLGALRARRGQALALLVLTVLAALGGSAAPWVAGWAHRAVADADIATAPIQQRLVTVSGSIPSASAGADPVEAMRREVEPSLDIPGATGVVSLSIFVSVKPQQPVPTPPSASTSVKLSYRDGACAHLTLVFGGCPVGPGEVALSRRVAGVLGVTLGDSLISGSVNDTRPTVLRVVGVYEIADPLGPYWASAAPVAGTRPDTLDEVGFASMATVLAGGSGGTFTVSYRMSVPGTAFGDDEDLVAAIATARERLRPAHLSLDTAADGLAYQIRRDQHLVATGIQVATIQLVLLCWFALYLAVRYTSEVRRPDIGLLKLRGVTGRRLWALIGLQSAVPTVAGAAVGWSLGLLAARVLAWSLPDATPLAWTAPTLFSSLAAVAVVGLGAMAVALVTELRSLRSPVTELLRHVPSRRRDWRTQVGDLAVVVLAIAGVYQGYADRAAQREPSVLALLAPGLVALAVALLVGRALPWLAASSGTAALRAGRAAAALSALHVARRPGTQRVFAVVAVAVAVLTTTLLTRQTATRAWEQRAVAETGAARVLSVRVDNSAHLSAAVRAADPDGRYAMAVARGFGLNAQERVLAVDTSRLATVALLPPELGLPDAAALAALLHPAARPAPSINDGRLTLDAGLAAGTGPIRLTLQVVSPDGAWHDLTVGPLAPGRRHYLAPVTGCADGCRLASLGLAEDGPSSGGPPTTVDLYGLDQAGRVVVSGDEFADISRWRPPIGGDVVPVRLDAGDGRLRLTRFEGDLPAGFTVDPRVFVADTPVPLPAVIVGDRPGLDRAGDQRIRPLGGQSVAYQVVATGRLLPGSPQGGVLVDLDYAQRSAAPPADALAAASPAGAGPAEGPAAEGPAAGPVESVGYEVWLTADAPDRVVDELRRHGLTIFDERGVAAAIDRLAQRGPGPVLAFELLAAALILLVAAGTIVVAAAVERLDRAGELAALRAQGLPRRRMRSAAYAGTAAITAGAVPAGLLAALLARVAVTAALPIFSDAWSLLPVPATRPLAPVAAAALAAAVVLGAAAVAGAAGTVRAVDRSERPS